MTVLTFKPNIFPGVFVFCVGVWDSGQLVEFLHDNEIADTGNHVAGDPPPDECNARCYYPEVGFPVVWIRHNPKTPAKIGSLVHEIEHALMFYLNWLGIEHGRPTTEVYAYMMDRILTGVLEYLWHKNKLPGITVH